MQISIPPAPRRVPVTRVPGTLARLGRVLLGGLLLMAALGAGAAVLDRFVVEEQGFLARSESVEGQLVSISLPPLAERDGGEARLEVLYEVRSAHYSASGVRARVEDVEGLGRGARVPLRVDPAVPDRPREERYVRARARALGLVPWGLWLGALGALGLFAWELRRTLRVELEPLRKGALVWLTPDAALPESRRREALFPATYWKQDQKYAVRARLRGGRAPVRNGDKVLAAVLSSLPDEARVIDEELARTLNWVR